MIRICARLALSGCVATSWVGCSEDSSGDNPPTLTQDASTDSSEAGPDAPIADAGQQDAEASVADGGQDAPTGDAEPESGADAAPDGGQNLLFDLPAIEDASTAQCMFTDNGVGFSDGVLLQRYKVSYLSWEVVGGALKPIVIRGYASRPQTGNGRPGVVVAHGLGGYGDQGQADSLAAKTGTFAIAYSGPGSGNNADNTSEGAGPFDGNGNWYRLFDVIADTRGSWFWAHAVAGMRGLTCLQSRSEVDGTKLGMTGYSGGGIATLIAAGVDPRIKAAIPVSSSHAFDVAAQSPGAWWHALLNNAGGLTTSSPEWLKLHTDLIAPAASTAHISAPLMMINGTSDEFFPLIAHVATYAAATGDKRTSLVGNYDHGCFQKAGVELEKSIQDRASLRQNGGQTAWFHHAFGTDADFATIPTPAQVQVQPQGASIDVSATVDTSNGNLKVEQVAFWWSTDDAYTWIGMALDPAGGSSWAKNVAVSLAANAIYYVDVQYSTKALINPVKFSISTVPVIPAGSVPHIRDQTTCQ
jgi:cephalosporin-C deacetylase-like acetyl esterase